MMGMQHKYFNTDRGENTKAMLLILFFASLALFGNAQKSGFYWRNLNENSNRLQGKLRGEVYDLGMEANDFYFLQPDWVTATLTMADGDVFEEVRLRYLAYGDEIVAYNTNISTMFTIEKEMVQKFTYPLGNGGQQAKFIKLCANGVWGGCHFYQELYAGQNTLLAFHHVDEVKTGIYNDKHGIRRDTEFRLYVDYFLYDKETGLQKMQQKRRWFIKTFPENKREIKRILRKNQISIIDQHSLTQAFKLLDEAGVLN